MSPPSKAGSAGNYGRGDGGRTDPTAADAAAASPSPGSSPTHSCPLLCFTGKERSRSLARSLTKGGEEKAAEGRRETYTHYAM